MMNDARVVVGLGEAGPVALPPSSSGMHGLIWGTTGAGKSRYLASLFLQHLAAGRGVCLIDPHGDLASLVLSTCVRHGFFRRRDAFSRLVYADFGGGHVPFNILSGAGDSHTRALCALEGMTRTWPEVKDAPLFSTVFLSAALVLADNGRPLTDLGRLLLDRPFRQQLLVNTSDPLAHQALTAFDRSPAQAGSTLRRSFLLSFSPIARGLLGHSQNVLPIRRFMDTGVSLIANLGSIPDPITRRLIGSLLLTQIEQAALSRADSPPSTRRPWTCLVDEWPTFAASSAESLTSILSQTRKYGLSLHLAAQSLEQIESDRLRGALENCRLSVTFRLGHASARMRAAQLADFEIEPARPRASRSRAESVASWTQTLTTLTPRRAIVQAGEGQPQTVTTLVVRDSPTGQDVASVQERYRAQLTQAARRERTIPTTEPQVPDILEVEHAIDNTIITDFAAFFAEDAADVLPV